MWGWLHPLSLLPSPPRGFLFGIFLLWWVLTDDLAFKQDCRQTKKNQGRPKQNYIIVKRFWPRFTLWWRHQAPRAHDMSSQPKTRERRNWYCKLVLTSVHLVVSTPGPQSIWHELSTKGTGKLVLSGEWGKTAGHISPKAAKTPENQHNIWRQYIQHTFITQFKT
jgi:hypothetical protein